MRPRSPTGVSVPELIVALFILSVLSSTFVMLFNKSRSSTEGGSQRIQMRALQREAQRRLTLLLRSAIAPNEVDPALVAPSLDESAAELRFHAPLDLLDPGLVFDPRDPEYPEFLLDLSAEGALVVRRSDGDGARQSIGRGFQSVEFHRESKRSVAITLTAQTTVRGDSGARKTVRESSRNLVQLPGIR